MKEKIQKMLEECDFSSDYDDKIECCTCGTIKSSYLYLFDYICSNNGYLDAGYSLMNDIFYFCDIECLITKLDFYDRTDFSVTKKPLRWPCYFCPKIMGGGCRWYANVDMNIDICEKCYEKVKTNKIQLKAVDNLEHCYVGTYSKKFIIDPRLFELKEDNTDFIHDLVECRVCAIDPECREIFKWNFTEFFLDEFDPLHIDSIRLLKDVSSESYGRVAITVQDDHGRLGMFLLYDSYDELLTEYETWKEKNKDRDMQEVYQNMLRDVHILSEEEIIDSVPFILYVAFTKRIPLHYG